MRKALVVTAVTAVGLVGALQGSASAGAGDTVATFTLSAGSIGISVPAGTSQSPVSLGSTSVGSLTLAGQLGNVTVTDARGLLAATWTATVSSTDFTTGASPTANQTVAKANILYSAGTGSALAGQNGTLTGAPIALAAAVTGAAWAGVGNNTVTWNPTLTFTLLASQVAGTYTGTITHSVA